MTYMSFTFYGIVLAAVLLYYLFPMKWRWLILLTASLGFYWRALDQKAGFALLLGTVALAFGAGLLLQKKRSQALLICAVALVALPWFLGKNGNYVLEALLHREGLAWIVPVGISFYTLQLISYLSDVYLGRCEAQRNPAKFALYALFFPQIVQGPIPRYDRLSGQLFQGHSFRERVFVGGLYRILWGYFLKWMIADRAAVAVNEIFDHSEGYPGCYVLVAGILYSLQLYADFSACVSISRGVANLFGIELVENFRRPYFAVSVKDFWRRWHLSLSEWLKDYVYIPLGGSRKGKARTYINLILTFLVSGVWHGAGLRFVAWGLLHALYQIAGQLTEGLRNRLLARIWLAEGATARIWLRRFVTFFCVMTAWILFRAQNLSTGLKMIVSMFRVHNPWIFTDDSLLRLGLDWKEWVVLGISAGILFAVSLRQERGESVAEAVYRQPLALRWALCLFALFAVMTFGAYGMGYDAKAFIYGGF